MSEMKTKTTRLTDRESRILHGIERMIVQWEAKKPFSSREQPEWGMCIEILTGLDDLKSDLLDGE